MACCFKKLLGLFALSGVALAALVYYLKQPGAPFEVAETGYWGSKRITKPSDIPKDDEAIYKFNIDFDEKMVTNLKEELAKTRWVKPLEDSNYRYGVNLKTFKDVIDHWRTKYNFKAELKRINAYPHYKTQIEGIGFHFFHSAPKVTSPSTKVIPILMVHGWPGSFVEFLKIAPMLNKIEDNVVFDIIVPSLPGYGYSDPAEKKGMDGFIVARIFKKLMQRLGYEKYYVQGGDWGSFVTIAMASLYPENVRAIHLNLEFASSYKPLSMLKSKLISTFPQLFGDGHQPRCLKVNDSFVDKLEETGYMHIQATKPDTVGFALINNAAGLAAYILEKFSTATDRDFRDLEDGGLTRKFDLDDMLTNVMVYYATNSMISSQRFYKEQFNTGAFFSLYNRPITVPTGFAVFPNEISCAPRWILEDYYTNITSITYQEEGGHFAAMEVPHLLSKDVRQFALEVERLFPIEWKRPAAFKAIAAAA